MTTKFEQYKTMTADLRKLEAAIEQIRKAKAELARNMLSENGKGHVYDLDGVPMIISSSKNGSCFLTPRDKGGRRNRKALKAQETAPMAQEAAPVAVQPGVAPKRRGRPPKAKKAIIDGHLVEVQAELKPKAEEQGELPEAETALEDFVKEQEEQIQEADVGKPLPGESALKFLAREEVELQAKIEGQASLLGGVPLAQEASKVEEPVVAPKEPETAPEANVRAPIKDSVIDPLEAALAEIERPN